MKILKFKTLLKNLEQSRHAIAWQRILEHPRLAKSLLKKGILLILDKVTKESCISLHLFLRNVYTLGRKSGWLHCALYLKQCVICLKIAYGGIKIENPSTGISVSLTRSGYPRIIPRFARILMYKRDARADQCVKVYLTFLSFYTIIIMAKKINFNLFTSICSPVQDIDKVITWLGLLKPKLKELFLRYVPDLQSIPLHQGMRWRPSWKTLPTYHTLPALRQIFPELKECKSPYVSQTMELAAYSSLIKFIHKEGEQWSSGILFPHRIRYPFDTNNKLFSGTDLDEFESKIGPYLPPWHPSLGPPMTGKLACKIDGGGKRRIFAIGNWVNQRLLTPVHSFIADVLRKIPMDGTFNQLGPLIRLEGCQYNYCYDLTAATDRWPLVFMFETMVVLFDRSFASAVVNSALACNLFFIRFLKDSKVTNPKHWISFVAGQPLGYRSSWPLFALTHHILVWWSAEQVYPGTHFDKYALLGDDIVISDSAVAAVYKEALAFLQVKISLNKSLISKTGAAEFAKRFYIHNIKKELSSITLKALLGVHIPICRLGLAYRYSIKRYSTFRRLGGAGYKSCSRVLGTDFSSVPHKEKEEFCLWVQFSYPSLSWFFGKGRPLKPTEFWFVFRMILKAYKPNDLQRPPAEAFVSDEQLTFLEYTSLRSQAEESLQYIQWWFKYYRMANCHLNYQNHHDKVILDRVTLDEVFDAPYVSSAWCLSNRDHLKVRFTLLHRLLNKLEKEPQTVCLGQSDPGSLSNEYINPFNQWCLCWKSKTLIQGSGENTFLVNQVGLIIPPESRCKGCGFKSLITP